MGKITDEYKMHSSRDKVLSFIEVIEYSVHVL
jgi:hypothetical protein